MCVPALKCCKDDQVNPVKEILIPVKKLDYTFPKISSSHKPVTLSCSPNARMLAPEMFQRDWQWIGRWTGCGKEAARRNSSIQLAESSTRLWIGLRHVSRGEKTGTGQKSQTGSPEVNCLAYNNIFSKF